MITYQDKPLFFLAILIRLLFGALYAQFRDKTRLEAELKQSKANIELMQEQQDIAEKVLAKYPELLKAQENEHAERKKKIEEIIKNNSDWSSQRLPFDFSGLLSKDTAPSGSISASAPVAR